MENMSNIGIPVCEKEGEIRENDGFVQLLLNHFLGTHHQSVFAVEEVFVQVHECDHLLQNLQMRHADQTLQNVQEVHIVALRFELHVIVRTDFGEWEES